MWKHALWLVAVVACGDKSPVEKCDDLVDTVCDRAVECVPSAGTHAECVAQVQQAIACGTAKSVSSTYDRCINQIDGDTCAVLFPDTGSGPKLSLPADCNDVILTRERNESRWVPEENELSSLPSEY